MVTWLINEIRRSTPLFFFSGFFVNGFCFLNQNTNCKADRTAKKGNNFIAQSIFR